MLGVIAGHDPRDPRSLAADVPDYLAAIATPLERPRLGLLVDFLDRSEPEVSAQLQEVAAKAQRGRRRRSRGPADLAGRPVPGGPRHHDADRGRRRPRHLDRARPLGVQPANPGVGDARAGRPVLGVPPRPAAAPPPGAPRRPLLHADVDAFLLPTASNQPPGPETTGDASFQSPWSLLGLPSISLPSGVSDGRAAVRDPACRPAPGRADAAARRDLAGEGARLRRPAARELVSERAPTRRAPPRPVRGSERRAAIKRGVRDAYDVAAPRYEQFIMPTFVPIGRRILALARPNTDDLHVDLATGTGLVPALADDRRMMTCIPPWRVAMDFSASMLRAARQNARSDAAGPGRPRSPAVPRRQHRPADALAGAPPPADAAPRPAGATAGARARAAGWCWRPGATS